MQNNLNNIENNSQTKNTPKIEYVFYNQDNRITERDGLLVQFFDRIKQTTNNYLQTIDVVNKKNKPVYGLYVEIYNPKDIYNVVCKEVELQEIDGKKEIVNNITLFVNQGNDTYPIVSNYANIYKKAFANYQAMQQNKAKPYPTFADQMTKRNSDPTIILSNYLTENNNSNDLI